MVGSWSRVLGIEIAPRAPFNPDFTPDGPRNLDSGTGHSSTLRAGRPSRLGIAVPLVQCQRSVTGPPIPTPTFDSESVATIIFASTPPFVRSATVEVSHV